MTVEIFRFGKHVIDETTEFFVGKCSSGHTVFGERANLYKVLAKHLVFKTESGSLVKTDYNMNTVGKAAKNHYWVGFGDRTGNPNYINQRVYYWNEKKCCIEYK